MSLIPTNGDPKHFPARRNAFEFDGEVASIFDNMAPRSIPMYAEAHRLHVSLLRPWLRPGVVIADIGSSTGQLFHAIGREFETDFNELGINGIAVDSSPAMMDRLRAEFPKVETHVCDITEASDFERPVDIMVCLYVLQFIEPGRRDLALDWIARNLSSAGMLVLGQKEKQETVWADTYFAEEYYKFRRDNGYSQEEIDAKTKALKNSMWPVTAEQTAAELQARGFRVYETTRWLQFSTLLAVRS